MAAATASQRAAELGTILGDATERFRDGELITVGGCIGVVSNHLAD